jgi:uncharacterized protein (TIGR00290 family)
VGRKPVFLSWSGGKDSALALQSLQNGNEFDVVGLLTSVTRGYDRISVHGVRRSLLEAQAASVGLPLREILLDPQCTNDAYESAFHDSLDGIRKEFPDVRHIAFGDLFLEDVRAYRERLLGGTGFEPVFPLWGLDTAQLARRFIDDGFRARLVCVDTTQLDGQFAGRVFDTQLLDELSSSIDPCGERGEFHTFVSDGPGFDQPVECVTGERVLREERFMYCDLVGSTDTALRNESTDLHRSDIR